MNKRNIIKKILKFSPRSGENEMRVVNLIKKILNSKKINHQIQYFYNYYPKEKSCDLNIDGKSMKSQSCCFESGKIRDKKIVNSIDFDCEDDGNVISYNPECDGVSLSTYYRKASLAIKRGDLKKIKNAINVSAVIKIVKQKFRSANILLGNSKNPRNVLFCHFDSVLKGAVDNASGVSVLLDIAISDKKYLKNNLLVFSGSEEISYDWPIYWGYGYRIFEKEHGNLLDQVSKILVIDSVGNGISNVSQDQELQKLAFPINELSRLKKKIFIVHGDMDKLMKIYHSDLDDVDQIEENVLDQTKEKILQLII